MKSMGEETKFVRTAMLLVFFLLWVDQGYAGPNKKFTPEEITIRKTRTGLNTARVDPGIRSRQSSMKNPIRGEFFPWRGLPILTVRAPSSLSAWPTPSSSTRNIRLSEKSLQAWKG